MTGAVVAHMKRHGVTQGRLASALGVSQVTVSRKLSGVRAWSLDNLDALIAAGVEVPAPGPAMTPVPSIDAGRPLPGTEVVK